MGNTGSKDSTIAGHWKELSGDNNWNRLLQPLNRTLRKVIIHYGERVQAIYDSVNKDALPEYAKEELFSKVVLEMDHPHKLYTVTNYLYAVSNVDSKVEWLIKDQSAWIGFVAVATDEGKALLGRRDILICWRGTLLAAEYLKDMEFIPISASDIFGDTHNPYVHSGFHSLYTSPNTDPQSSNKSSARNQVLDAVRELVNKTEYQGEEISITVSGHSLGAALATLNAVDIVANGYNIPTGSNKQLMVTAFVFASPKVGDEGFKTLFDGLRNLHLLHIRNHFDIVPKLPPTPSYKKVGTQLRIYTGKSIVENLEDGFQLSDMLPDWHSLKQYFIGVAEL